MQSLESTLDCDISGLAPIVSIDQCNDVVTRYRSAHPGVLEDFSLGIRQGSPCRLRLHFVLAPMTPPEAESHLDALEHQMMQRWGQRHCRFGMRTLHPVAL